MLTIINADTGINQVQTGSVNPDDLSFKTLIQVVDVRSNVMQVFTSTIPYDDTIPQISEGSEVFNVTFTPKAVNSILVIDVNLNYGTGGATTIAALFDGIDVNAKQAFANYGGASEAHEINFNHKYAVSSLTPITFSVRIGNSAGNNTTINGLSSARKLGGAIASSMTITEISQ
jgi:hypothetical protein